ncbi:MAG: DUF4349 domain-containing protein [Actinobacteria bacterium]|nr:DUF4349 domain-containing protein [Actinomycetota bacterium]MCA1720310.1 DUF4349 domain-containing protein [Actinomycetota bacterium]
MSTLTDETLTALLAEAGNDYAVPAHGPAEVLAVLAEAPPVVPLVRRRWLQLSAAACVALAAVLLLTARSGDGGAAQVSAGSGQADSSGAVAGAPQAVTEQLARRDVATTPMKAAAGTAAGSAGTFGAAPAPAAPAPAGAQPEVAVPQQPVTAAVGDEGDSRVVKTGAIELVAPDKKVSSVLDAVLAAAKAQGGYVASSSTDEYGATPSGSVTVRVPVARFEALVGQVRRLAEVRTATSSGKDVTAQFADQEAQLRTLRATRERFLEILARTRTISEILAVQQRVDGVTGQIDRLEGAKKLLASQSDLSTLTVSVTEKDDVRVLAKAPRSGLSQAFHDAKDGFVSGIEAVVRHSGRALVWVLFLVLALVVGRLGWKVARRRLV